MATLFGSSFVQDLNLAQISVANTARDGTGTIVDTVVAGSRGSSVSSLDITAAGTTTAGMIRLYLHNGSNWRLVAEIAVSAITPSATVAAFTTTYTPVSPILLPNGWKLGTAPHNAETFNVIAKGVQY